jgi:hypothetical protein
MKIGIITVTHQSNEFRPDGYSLVKNFINSINCLTHEYKCIVVDNASTVPIELNNTTVIRVEDQLIYGLTGAWEIGLRAAISNECDVIIINNDDVEYNTSVNTFISEIISHTSNKDAIYGPLSNGILGGIQYAKQPTGHITELTNNFNNMVNGFMFAFTSDFYHKYKKQNGELFDKENYPWGGNEEEFQRRIWALGGKSFVLGNCWVSHKKIRGWWQFIK